MIRIMTVYVSPPGVPNHRTHFLARSWATCVSVLNFLFAKESTIRDLNASWDSSSGHQLLSLTKICPSRSGLTNVLNWSFIISSACVISSWLLLEAWAPSSFSFVMSERLLDFLLIASSSYCLMTACFLRTRLDNAVLKDLPNLESSVNLGLTDGTLFILAVCFFKFSGRLSFGKSVLSWTLRLEFFGSSKRDLCEPCLASFPAKTFAFFWAYIIST